jgi:enoyl-CoA hydratase
MIELEHQRKLVVFRLHHGKANLLDLELCEAIIERLEELRHAPQDALVLTAHGHIFSAGVDLLRLLQGGPTYVRTFLPALSRMFETLLCYPKPVVAAINGHAIAGGCVMAYAADYRVMARGGGRIGVTELLVGLPFPTIALEIMRFEAAPRHFQHLVYTGTTVSSEEAVGQGLVDASVEPSTLLEHALATAERLAALPSAVFSLTKRQVRQPVLSRLTESAKELDAVVHEIWSSPTALAAIRAYVTRTLKKSR